MEYRSELYAHRLQSTRLASIIEAKATVSATSPAGYRHTNRPSWSHHANSNDVLRLSRGKSFSWPIRYHAYLSSQDFHTILLGFCRDRIGEKYIRQRDYRILTGDDDSIVSPSDLSAASQVGKILELSIVVREETNTEERKCPRCMFINRKKINGSGWIVWYARLPHRNPL